MAEQFTPLSSGYPPRDRPIEWVTPSGQIEKGKWCGGAVWFPEGSSMYVYYTPISWRVAQETPTA